MLVGRDLNKLTKPDRKVEKYSILSVPAGTMRYFTPPPRREISEKRAGRKKGEINSAS